ncbi:MAG: Ig-like domain-containing protein [Thermoleophilia bacterium]|nr:Ig-like domain-containing protein [Thermoleophilia bacterium]
MLSLRPRAGEVQADGRRRRLCDLALWVVLALVAGVLVSVDEAGAAVPLDGAGAGSPPGLATVQTSTDINPPSTLLSTSPVAPNGDDGWFVGASPTVTLTATDREGSAATIYFDWGIDPPAGLYANSVTAPSGRKTLYYRSVDAAGNAETVASQLFKVDPSVTAPTMTAPIGPVGSPQPVGGTIAVGATASDAVSGVGSVRFYYFDRHGSSWNPVGTEIGAAQTAAASGSTYAVAWDTLEVLDGDYMLQAQVRDVAGNTAFSPAHYVRVDNSDPVASLAGPPEGSTISGTDYAITGTARDGDLSAWALEIRTLPAGEWVPLSSGTSNVVNGTLYALDTTRYRDGRYECRLSAIDRAGNRAVDVVGPVTVDNQKPTVVSAVSGGRNAVTVVFSEALDPASVSPSSFAVSGLTVSGAVLQRDGRTVILTTSSQADGTAYTVTAGGGAVMVTDLAGNGVGSPRTAGLTGAMADRIAPSPPSGLEATAGAERNVLSWSLNTEPDVVGYNVYRDTSAAGTFASKVNSALVRGGTGFDDTSYGAPGVYYYTVTAVDASGNESLKSSARRAELVHMSRTIGVEGGALRSSTGEIVVVIPAGALPSDRTVQVDEMPRPEDLPGLTFTSPVYDLLPSGQAFGSDISVTIEVSPALAAESGSSLFYDDAGTWKAVEGGSTVDAPTRTVTGRLARFTLIALASADTAAPTVRRVIPAPGTAGVSPASFVTLVFSEPMDADTLDKEHLQIRGPIAAIPLESVVFSADRTTVYLYPAGVLRAGATFTVFVDGAAVTDVAGNPLGDDFAAAFTTSAAEVSPHGTYSEASNLCRNCHLVRGFNGPKGFTVAGENAVCYTCHDGTGATLGGPASPPTTGLRYRAPRLPTSPGCVPTATMSTASQAPNGPLLSCRSALPAPRAPEVSTSPRAFSSVRPACCLA